MMYASKANKVYPVDANTKVSFAERGFDILDDDGKIIEHAKGKKIDYAKYQKLAEENEKLAEENARLAEENKKLTAEKKKGK